MRNSNVILFRRRSSESARSRQAYPYNFSPARGDLTLNSSLRLFFGRSERFFLNLSDKKPRPPLILPFSAVLSQKPIPTIGCNHHGEPYDWRRFKNLKNIA